MTTVNLPQLDADDHFAARLRDDGQSLRRSQLTTLQINVGKMCNLACHHCHVEAGPNRTEIMTWQTMARILDWIDAHAESLGLQTIDLTGGAPEMNPHFRELVHELTARGLHVIDRCNLTILLQPDYHDMIDFLAAHRVEIIASLPCYLEDNVDQQRGRGVYHESIDILQQLNAVGYGKPGTGLALNLVYNPVGYGLPGDQASLERDYKKYLADHFDITFDHLFTITNMPIKRFEHALRRDGQYDAYMEKIMTAHRGENVDGVMCRSLVSIGWQGSVYDCDFNQMLLMPLDGPGKNDAMADEHAIENTSRKLWDYTPAQLLNRAIATDNHCFGCTAGAGSSCGGALGSA